MQNKISLFEGKKVRKIWHNKEWYFSVIDVIEILTQSIRPRKYWNDLKKRVLEEWFTELSAKIGQLKMQSNDWKFYLTDVTNTETLLRIIQSIPSPKAEPFKLWLAQVWYERIQEIENPELAQERMKTIYEQKWYPKEWIDKRLRWIAVRQDLTDEWKNRWAKEWIEYAILTNEIMKSSFWMDVDKYKDFKWLQKENLRDHMNDIELILTMLWEATTTKLHRDRDSKWFDKLKKDAKEWWEVAWKTRQDIEQRSWKPVSSKENFLWLWVKKVRKIS